MTHSNHRRRGFLRQIAADTVAAIFTGNGYTINGKYYHLHAREAARNTHYFPPDHPTLSHWPSPSDPTHHPLGPPAHIAILEISTLEGALLLTNILRNTGRSQDSDAIGVLNFANAKVPGGGFLNGSQAQEESIARSSTLYATLTTRESSNFYHVHKMQQSPYYTHAMIYSPGIEIFRDDDGQWLRPVEVDVLTSAAVNAKEVRQSARGRSEGRVIEQRIELVMKERMARILCLFELQGARNLVLGSFGTGVFQNDVALVARVWAELLEIEGARFKHSFDRVIFAIVGRSTFEAFDDAFKRRCRGVSASFMGNTLSTAYSMGQRVIDMVTL